MINGVNYAWGNLSWVIFGVPLIGITEMEYTRKRVVKNNYGAGDEPTSRGLGNFEYSGSITVYTDEIRAILKNAPNKSILEIPMFSATNIFSGDGVLYNTDKLKNISFTEDPFAAKQGDTAILCKIPFEFAGLFKS